MTAGEPPGSPASILGRSARAHDVECRDMADEVASRVIVGVDGSTSSLGAVGWAGDYAAATGAPITLVAAWEWPTSYGWSIPMPVDYNPSGDAQRILDDAAATLREPRSFMEFTPLRCRKTRKWPSRKG